MHIWLEDDLTIKTFADTKRSIEEENMEKTLE